MSASRLVAYFGNDPERVACALFPARAALTSHEARPIGGWGLGFVQAGDVLLQKRPRSADKDVDFFSLAKDLRAEALIGRVGMGEIESTHADDADPFRFRSWLFGSIGGAGAWEGARDKILESVPDFLRRNIRGRSASEHLFHLFLAFLHDGGLLDNPRPPAEAVLRALRASVTFFDRLLAGAGANPTRLAIVATNGRCLVASGRTLSVAYLEINGIPDCPVCRGRAAEDSERRVSHDLLRAIVLEADGRSTGRPGWRPVPAGMSLLADVDRVPRLVGPE